jgi:serine/threonine-protein kinase
MEAMPSAPPVRTAVAADHERLTELFGEAMDLEPPARRAMLEQLSADEPDLARELAALLDEDIQIVTALRTAGFRPSDFASGVVEIAKLDGATLDIPGLRLGEQLGAGGMGVVFAAEDDANGRSVAVKVLHAASPEARARFRAEAEIMRTLEHPGIARVHGTGEADGRPYIVMERIVGATLDAYVRREKPTLRDRLSLMISICDAVHYAHGRGVIHRDLKPANVMVRADGSVAVLDFGVARAAAVAGATRAGDLLGTPLYMSPEQAMARPDEIDARADVYALGVTLFELVADRPPFDLRGLSLPASLRKVLQQPAPSLGQDELLDPIAARALAKLPDQRYPTAASLAGDLRRYMTVSARNH